MFQVNEAPSKDRFDIDALGVWSSVVILVVSLSFAILLSNYVVSGRGRMIFFSTMMSLTSLYTANGMRKYAGAKMFLSGYIAIHIAILFFPFSLDAAYPGPILFPFAIADYVAMVFGLRKCTLAWMK